MKATSLWTLGLLAVSPFLHAQVKETPAVLALVEGGNPQGFVTGSNDQGILFATASGGTGQLVTYERIRGEGLDKLIRFDERAEVLGAARALFAAEKYAEAAEAFGKVARDYAILLGAPQNFASEALFYQIESLKRAGLYQAMPPLVNSPAAATITTKLKPVYHRLFEFQKLWSLFGQGDMAALKAAIGNYEEPQTGDAKLLKTPGFKSRPPHELSQLGFLRAKVYESEGAEDKAIEDYYRSFTLAFANDPLLAKLSMGGAMQLQRKDPRIAADNKAAVSELQSIAYLYSQRFGKESMPPEFQKYAVRPPTVRPEVVPAEAPAEAPAPDGAAPAPDAAKPAPEEKPAEKAK